MNQFDPENILDIGTTLHRIARFVQKTYPAPYMTMGQDNEAEMLRRLLPETTACCYVDVGAGDPQSLSNTWHFYCAGWHGLLIEPLPEAWYRLLRVRPRDHLVPIAVSNYQGIGRLRACKSVSSLRPDWDIHEQAEILVEVDTLANILSAFPEIRDTCRLCSIDVEGCEKQVLEGIDWETFRPDVFVVEHVVYNPTVTMGDSSVEWGPLLLAQGYHEAAKTNFNHIYSLAPPPQV